MTILSMIQNVVTECQLTADPSIVIGSSENIVLQLKVIADKVGRKMRRRHPFTELNVEKTFALVAGQAAYPLPADFDFEIWGTHWNRSEAWSLIGPLSAQEWQLIKSGTVTTTDQQYRLKGLGINQYYLDPTPGSGNAGQTMVFEYQTRSTVKPRTFATGQTYSAASYCWYDGTLYYSTSGGITNGATPLADAGVTDWAVSDATYDTFAFDTDCSKWEEDILEQGMKAYYKREKKLEGWEDDMAEFWGEVNAAYARSLGAWVTNFDQQNPDWRTMWPVPKNVS